MSSPSPPENSQDVSDSFKEELFKNAMQGNWEDLAVSYAEKERVRETRMTRGEDTLLHLAASSGKENSVIQLIARFKTEGEHAQKILEIQNERGDTALHIAAAHGMAGACLALARLHPRMVVENLNKRKETPLFKAVRHGHKKAFFALQYVVETRIGDRKGEVVRGEGGNTILHHAIFAQKFDLALEIIHLYPDMVDAMNAKGESPLHVLANKPSVFKSGSRFSLLDSVIYYCILEDPIKVQYTTYKDKYSKDETTVYEKDSLDVSYNLPDNYKPCYTIFALLNHILKNIGRYKRLNNTYKY